jgi:hypothetical protein
MTPTNAFSNLVRDLSRHELSVDSVRALLRDDTYLALLVEFGTAAIPLEELALKYFGLSRRRAKELAHADTLPVPSFKCGSQKSQWLVHAQDLANYIDQERDDQRVTRSMP